jgi:hypothetical protein
VSLLEGDANPLSQLLLAHTEESTTVAHASGHMAVDIQQPRSAGGSALQADTML